MAKSLLEAVTQIVTAFAWPATIVMIVYLFRVPLTAKLERVKSARGPGGTGVDFDLVQRIVTEGQAQKLNAEQITAKIQQAISDKDQLRILRALLTEENGRLLVNYQLGNYKHALEDLIGKGLVRKSGAKFYLTESGLAAVRANLAPVFTSDANKRESEPSGG